MIKEQAINIYRQYLKKELRKLVKGNVIILAENDYITVVIENEYGCDFSYRIYDIYSKIITGTPAYDLAYSLYKVYKKHIFNNFFK